MNSQKEINCERAFNIVDSAVFEEAGKHLTDLERNIFFACWEGMKYQDIAGANNYSSGYVKNTSSKLWKKLSKSLGEQVQQKNFKTRIALLAPRIELKIPEEEREFPNSPLALNSNLYIQRPPNEELCYQTVLTPGSLIRIKALSKTGKTSLLIRILAHAKMHSYRTVYLSLREIETNALTDLDKFLRLFCANIAKQLQIEPELDKYWDKELYGSISSCTKYFEEHLLEKINTPIVLCLDNVDRLFKHHEIALNFFALLRNWYEVATQGLKETWEQLRLVVTHSTEPYVELDVNQSPFGNVGRTIELSEFTLEQIQNLAKRYGLDWSADNSAERLRKLVGGHPFLVNLALYYLRRGDKTLDELLDEASTQAGVYSDHLRCLLETLKEHSELKQAFQTVLEVEESVRLEPSQAYQLESIGLVKKDKNDGVKCSCELYRLYFDNNLKG
ncbi:MAG: AAA-like domain-containing protein [Prochloraceae cyanobacterium]